MLKKDSRDIDLQSQTFSIVAASGLISHALGSWKASREHHVWLRDFLPNDLPEGIRVLFYGYDTKLTDRKNKSRILDLRKPFLGRLRNVQDKARTGYYLPIYLKTRFF